MKVEKEKKICNFFFTDDSSPKNKINVNYDGETVDTNCKFFHSLKSIEQKEYKKKERRQLTARKEK